MPTVESISSKYFSNYKCFEVPTVESISTKYFSNWPRFEMPTVKSISSKYFYVHHSPSISKRKEIHQENSGIQIFPNPASAYVEFKILEKREAIVDEIRIFNFLGQMVLSLSDFGEISHRVDISGLSPGMYYLHALEKGRLIGSERFVKI